MPLDPCHIAPSRDADLILVGGGLANGLIAWRMQQLRPEVRVLVLEAGDTLGGNHTWSFHTTDLDRASLAWVQPLIPHQWSGHEVVFPHGRRRLNGSYASIPSARFAAVLSRALGDRLRTGVRVTGVTPREVQLADGRRLRARAVIDGRGVRHSRHLTLGYQKFLGQEVRLRAPHGLDVPMLMDASVAQTHGDGDDRSDGYRFVYVLPLAPDTLLIEDTFYADDPGLDATRWRRHIGDYAAAHGWQVDGLVREEQGVLPIVLSGDVEAFWEEAAGVPRSGLSAGLFHPTTGYSLPDAVAQANLVASLPQLTGTSVFNALREHAVARWHERGFFRLLNRMLFRAAQPSMRWEVMQRFYRLPEPLIARFYAARLSPLDKLRIVTGKPPVPVLAAVRAALDLTPDLRTHLP